MCMCVCVHRQLKYGKVLMLKWVYSTCKETIARLSGRQKKNLGRERQWEEGRETERGKERKIQTGKWEGGVREGTQGIRKEKEGKFR